MGHRDGVPASTIPLLQTKLFPPGAGGLPLLPRQALIDRLYEARGRRAMVLSAPAGFGKSTILCQLRLRLLEQGAAAAMRANSFLSRAVSALATLPSRAASSLSLIHIFLPLKLRMKKSL